MAVGPLMAFSLMGNLPRILGKRCGVSHTNGFFSLRRCRCGQSGWMEAPMLTRTMLFRTVLAVTPSLGLAQSTSPNGVRTLDPPVAIKAEGTWSLGVRAGDFVFVAGMQGMDPATNALVKDPQARILRAFLNLKLIAESEGASLQDCVRLTVIWATCTATRRWSTTRKRSFGASRLIRPHHGRGSASVRRRHR